MYSANFSLFFSDIFLESVNPSSMNPLGKTQQQATTGPTKGPRPTSSTPPIYSIPLLYILYFIV